MRTPSKAMLCSKLAIATALVVGATPAAAQSFQGTVGPGTIGATVNQSIPNETTVTVNQGQAVINWTATGPSSGGQTTFQAAGTTATFQGATDFAVLNRVSPTVTGDRIFLDGTINSLVSDVTGGTVYFYSPNGIVIGSNAVIDVGSLGLTTSPIANDGQGTWMTGFGGASPSVIFGNSLAGSYIQTNAGSQLNANGSGHYVALVAPRIVHQGTIRTDGAAALVGATGATITFATSNLFDIQVTTGSGDANGVVVQGGGTIERNSQTIGGDHRAYLVAVPANSAMTMLVQGGADLGFDIAGSAGVEGNAVVLSAGRNVFNGEDVGPPNSTASMTIDNAAFTSNVAAHATDTIQVSSWNGATSFSGSLEATANNVLAVQATANLLSIGGALSAKADNVGMDAIGGSVLIGAYNGTTMTVGGDVTLSAGGFGFSALDEFTDAGHGTGGTVLVQASGGGTVTIGGGLVGKADGLGGDHGYSNGAAGDGTGGLVQILANDPGSTISMVGMADLTANGEGGTTIECTICTISGGDGIGGQIDIISDGGIGNSLTFGTGLWAIASGIGGAGDAGAGLGQGGGAYLASGNGGIINSDTWLIMFADGVGGDHLGAGTAGSGTGGTAGIGSFGTGGGQINIADSGFDQMFVTAEGSGGNATGSSGDGGSALGGYAFVDAPGATLTATGDLYVSALAVGGNAANGTGGGAIGGHAAVKAQGASATFTGNLTQRADGTGGNGLTGGLGQGGLVELHADNGATLTISGRAEQDAYGDGGDGSSGGGGYGDGGTTSVYAANAGTLGLYELESDSSAAGGDGASGGAALGGDVAISTSAGGAIDVSYQAFAEADARGGFGFDGNGGNGDAGSVTLLAAAGTIDAGDLANLSATGSGGATGGSTSAGGAGEGGLIVVGASDGGTLTMLSTVLANALGRGGGAFQTGATGGDGLGGTIDFRATGIGSTIDARFFVSLDASGTGGFAGGDCNDCGGSGGDGTGGLVNMQTYGGTGNRILLGNDIELLANGSGTSGYGGPGGNGLGGEAYVNLNDDGVIDVTGNLSVRADGSGGYQSNGGFAGNGTGGDAAINLTGTALSVLSVGGATLLSTDGWGGGTGLIASGTAGSGTGGWSRIFGTGGNADFTGNVTVSANGTGGDAFVGTGGNGVGGLTRVNTDGADYDFGGDLGLTAISIGGSGTTGGDALAFVGDNPKGTATTDARIVARNGSITVLGATSLDVSAVGGAGAAGGAGGDAASGYATVHARNSDLGPATVTLADLSINASSTGGAGGAGISGNVGGDGGAGGSANGGFVAPTASAGNGHLVIGNVAIDGTATGGVGGDGGSGEIGAGGNGGAGGAATGAGLYIGTESGEAAALGINEGSASFASIGSVLDALGGDGGWGGSGTTNGVGGVGGAASGGDAYLAARGSIVTVGDVIFTGHATGGAGGRDPFETLSGAGGNATAGGLGVTATNRAGNTAMRGTVNAGTVSMAAYATGGVGSTDGLGYAGGRNTFDAVNSDITLGSFAMLNAGSTGADPAGILDPVYVANGTVAADGDFTIVSPGVVSLRLDNAVLTAADFTMDAGNFIPDSFFPAVTTLGTVDAGTITLTSSQDVIVDAHLVGSGNILIDAGGLIDAHDLTTTGVPGNIALLAGGTIDALTVAASGALDLLAGGNVTLGNVSAGTTVDLAAGGSLSGGSVTAGGALTASSAGTLNLGNIAALTASVSGLSVTLGSVNLTGLFDAQSDSFFTSEDITTGESLSITVVGDITTTAITTPGGIYFDAGGDIATSALDAGEVDLVAAGNIGVGNAVVDEYFTLEAGGSITAGNVTAGDSIELEAAGAVVAGNLSAGLVNPSINELAEHNVGVVSASSVTLGDVDALGWVGIGSFGTVAVNSIGSQNDVLVLADGNITSGPITTGSGSRLLIAGADLVEAAGGVDDFDRSIAFNAVDLGNGVPTAGSVTIDGPIEGYKLDLLVGNGLTAGAINADEVDASVGGTATINGQWNVDLSTVMRSNDIAIGADGGISGDEILLVSTNATQTLIGDGLSGSGYALSNSEFGRLDGVFLSVLGNSASSAAIDTLIGDVTVSAPNFGFGYVGLGTVNPGLTAPDGTVRVVGSVTGTGFGPEHILSIDADRVEVDAETATISLTGQQGELGGILIFDADQVHVAEAAILDQLADDPNYVGRDQDLATPISEERPDGLIRAGEIYVNFTGSGTQSAGGISTNATPLYSLMVQNVGSRSTPAGFVANYAEVNTSEGTPDGSVDMIVNGQIVTEEGTLTGVAVRDALVEVNDPQRFTPTSRINGCALTGPCIIRLEAPPVDPTPSLATQITLINIPTGDDLLFGNEETIEDNEEDGGEDSASSPIQPPTPLFNTKPLEQPGDTNEPVSGGGNPALIGNGPNPVDEEDE